MQLLCNAIYFEIGLLDHDIELFFLVLQFDCRTREDNFADVEEYTMYYIAVYRANYLFRKLFVLKVRHKIMSLSRNGISNLWISYLLSVNRHNIMNIISGLSNVWAKR